MARNSQAGDKTREKIDEILSFYETDRVDFFFLPGKEQAGIYNSIRFEIKSFMNCVDVENSGQAERVSRIIDKKIQRELWP